MAKVLIATAWWPTKTGYFPLYSQGVIKLLTIPEITTELFITTVFSQSKFRGIVDSLVQAQEWALAHDFTHMLILDTDIVITTKNLLVDLVALDKPVIIPGRGNGKGLCKLNSGNADNDIGWSCCLVKTEVLNLVSIDAIAGEYLWPDRMWFKKLATQGIDVWRCYDITVDVLQPSANVPMAAFQPNKESGE